MNAYLLGQLFLRKNISLSGSRYIGAIGTLSVGFTVEWLQYLDVDIFGTTFGPWDLLIYTLGAVLGVIIDFGILEILEKQVYES